MTSGIKKVFATSLTTVRLDKDAEGVGTVRFEGELVYKYVRFTGTTAVNVGDVMCYTDNTLHNVDGANAAVGAGIATAAVASGAQAWGWVLAKGRVVLSQAVGGTTPAAGNELTVTLAPAGTVVKKAAVTDCLVGVAVDIANRIIDARFPW